MKKIYSYVTVIASILSMTAAHAARDGTVNIPRDPLKEKQYHAHQVPAEKTRANTSDKVGKTKNKSIEAFKLVDVEVVGNEVITKAELREFFGHLIGKTITDKETAALKKRIEDHYATKGYLLPVVYIYGKDPARGILEIAIIEGKIRNVDVIESDKAKRNIKHGALLRKYVDKILALNPIKTKDLEHYMLLIEKIPGYEVEYDIKWIEVENIANNEVADLLIKVVPHKLRTNVDFNNQGAKDIGKYQGSLTAQVFNPLMVGDALTLNAGTSNKPKNMQVYTVGYFNTFNSYGTTVGLLASYLKNRPNAASPESIKDDTNQTYKGQVAHYLLLNNTNEIKVEGGVEYVRSRSFAPQSQEKKYDSTNLFIGGEGRHNDRWGGVNTLVATMYQNVENSNIVWTNLSDQQFDKDYNIIKGNFFRVHQFKNGISISSWIRGQYSGKVLPVEHKFFVGGLENGRAYKSGLISTNKGFDMGIEPSYTKSFNNKFLSAAQIYAYHDTAFFSKKEASTTVSSLSSLGGGLRLFMLKDIVYATVEGGVPLKRTVVVNNTPIKNRTKFVFLAGAGLSW